MITKQILIIEDEQKVARLIQLGLEEHSISSYIAFDGETGIKLFIEGVFDLIILDVNLPEMQGFEVAMRIRKIDKSVPILMLTAMSSLDDKLNGFESGADDYLVKPFDFAELLVRIKALFKRSEMRTESFHGAKVSDLEINFDTKIVKRAGKRIDLTAREHALLEYLIRNRGRVVSREKIAESVWDLDFDTGTNVIDVYVNFLRKKIDQDSSNKLIHTVIGMGYILREADED